jgi:hypothetical protein
MNICKQHGLKNHDKNEALARVGTGSAIAGTATKERMIMRNEISGRTGGLLFPEREPGFGVSFC